MKSILVSGASGIVGYGILRSLRGLGYRLIGTTIYEESPANCFADIVEKAPKTVDAAYIPWLVETIKKYGVDMIIPGIEADVSAWNKNRELLENTGAVVLLNRAELIELCMDKWAFYCKLKDLNIKYRIRSSIYPKFEEFGTPFLLKPRCGYGSKGIIRVETKAAFEEHRSEIGKTMMMQEYVGTNSEEYTASAFFDWQSELKALIVMKRKLSTQGFTELAQVVPASELETVIIELASIFAPVGPTNFQFRRHQGEWKLLEINPRISSATTIRKAFGYNESEMSVEYFLQGKCISQPDIRSGHAIRYTEDYIFYDSDNI